MDIPKTPPEVIEPPQQPKGLPRHMPYVFQNVKNLTPKHNYYDFIMSDFRKQFDAYNFVKLGEETVNLKFKIAMMYRDLLVAISENDHETLEKMCEGSLSRRIKQGCSALSN